MAKALDREHGFATATHSGSPDWSKKMSDNVALALIIYTGLQIFVTVEALKDGVSSTIPYFALILLVGAIIPACRWFEKRWKDVPGDKAHDASLRSAYRRDQVLLWAIAIGLPFVLTAFFKAIFAA
ncbi:hypothetical protein LCM19_12220 [Qipengyuania flava]|nr:hypothetical protein [Qipengyuania flava]